MNVAELSSSDKQKILDSYEVIEDWKKIGPFCVDGRDGEAEFSSTTATKHLFVQALGGSLLIAVIQYIHSGGNFSEVLQQTILQLQADGFGCGVHRGSHASGEISDCGFADNLQKIINRMIENQDDIHQLISSAAPSVFEQTIFDTVIEKAHAVAKKPIDNGEALIHSCNTKGANLQTLQGEHAEVSAVVNLKSGYTLNTRQLVSQNLQAFNLDLWYVLDQAKVLNLDQQFVTHAALALYVATEMMLVEDKKHIRLPIVVVSE